MLGSNIDELQALVTAATQWRTLAASKGVDLFQINANMPDGRPVALVWMENAIETGDDTFDPDWEVRFS